jgi:polyhydroxyalkanoate synthesis regulator protein
MQAKMRENVKRLIGTIPLEKDNKFDSAMVKTQIDKRQALLEHCNHMVKYVDHLHRICEFIAVAADGYGNQPREFINSYYTFETITLNLAQVFDDGRGYAAIDQMNELYQRSEKNIERIRRAIRLRQLHQATAGGYVTS